MSLTAPQASLLIEPEVPADGPVVEALATAAFGPGRFAKTAERLRERARLAAGFVARDGGETIGSVRLWDIVVGETPALFLGPIAVAGERRKGGLGAQLVKACIDHARDTGSPGILLVGEASYFDRFGFILAPHARLPGPVDQRRVFWLGLGAPAAPTGDVRPLA